MSNQNERMLRQQVSNYRETTARLQAENDALSEQNMSLTARVAQLEDASSVYQWLVIVVADAMLSRTPEPVDLWWKLSDLSMVPAYAGLCRMAGKHKFVRVTVEADCNVKLRFFNTESEPPENEPPENEPED